MTAVIRGGIEVKPHVLLGCTRLEQALGLKLDFGTYPGHSYPEGPTQAVDIFNTDNDAGWTQQDRICAFLIANAKTLGVRYVIRREHIWNIERAAEGWRWQGHQGSRRLDHYDHVHVTFYASAPDVDDPYIPPTPLPRLNKENEMFMYSTAAKVDGGSFWLVVSGRAFRLHRTDDTQRIIDKGVPNFGEMSESFHNLFDHVG